MCKWCFECYIINKLSSLNPDKLYLWALLLFLAGFRPFSEYLKTPYHKNALTDCHNSFWKINLSLQSFIWIQFCTCLNHLNVMCAMPNNRPSLDQSNVSFRWKYVRYCCFHMDIGVMIQILTMWCRVDRVYAV